MILSKKFYLSPKRIVILVAILLAALVFILWLPSKNDLKSVSYSTAVFDRNGEMLRIFLTNDDKYRIKEPLAEFPIEFIQMVLLKEDNNFYTHPGVNAGALIKAGWNTYITRNYRMGASTITMQLARLQYGLKTATIPGKIHQIFKAFHLELRYSKQEILEAYMNLVPCGSNIEGFPAAAYYYYHKDLCELTLSEMFFLAVIPQSPTLRAPHPDIVPAASFEARSLLFSEWVKEHPEDSEYKIQMDMPVAFYCSFPFEAPHVAEYTKNLVENTPFTQDKNSNISESKILTTIDESYQNLIEREMTNYLKSRQNLGVNNSSIVLLDFTTMEVLAAVGSADFFNNAIEGQVNGFTAKRSPGSTLKPFIYALAMEQGLIHPNSMLKDTPTSFGVYTPDNYQSDFKGPVKAWEALVNSRNIPAVTLASQIKNPDLYEFLKKSGVTQLKDRDYYGLSIVLGSGEVTILELVSMYATLANQGVQYPIKFLLNSQTDSKNLTNGQKQLTEESSILTLRMLEKNPSPLEYRPAKAKQIPMAYKTGTSIGFKDCWSIGIFDRYVICVWIGNFNGEGNPEFLGRMTAAPLLFSIADSIIINTPEKDFYVPPKLPNTIKQVRVCSVSGCIPTEYCPNTILTDFIPGVSPITKCKIHRQVYIDTATGYRTERKNDPGVIETVREFWPTDLLQQFKYAGLPRITPPPMEPENSNNGQVSAGVPPHITSPLDSGNYIIRPFQTQNNAIPLIAISDADTSTLFWFSDNIFIGKTAQGKQLEWYPKEGNFNLTVLDDIGRSNTVNITVEMGK